MKEGLMRLRTELSKLLTLGFKATPMQANKSSGLS